MQTSQYANRDGLQAVRHLEQGYENEHSGGELDGLLVRCKECRYLVAEDNVEYGDSWAVKRKAKLKFLVDAYNGFEELSWTDR